MRKPIIIGIAGVAQAGKDTLFKVLRRHYERDFVLYRVALADYLKEELDPFTVKQFGLSVFTKNIEEKTLLRPLMVAYGKVKRNQTKGTYFTNLAQQFITSCSRHQDKRPPIFVITDIRYQVFEGDEADWLIHQNNGILIHIERNLPDGSKLLPPNDDEKTNDPILKSLAHLRVVNPAFISCIQDEDDLINKISIALINDGFFNKLDTLIYNTRPEEEILALVESLEQTEPSQLVTKISNTVGLAEELVKCILWNLLSQKRLEFTEDWTLRRVPEAELEDEYQIGL